ncbi:hypothetical protein ACHAO7_011099 [Fusarium culmorum]|nr:hypothetical protein FGRA07_11694 [Fusarium graminearum]
MPKVWKEPQDRARSFKIRTEGLMRKCKDLTNLGVRVALYIENEEDGTVLRYKTDPSLIPSWQNAGSLPERPRADTQSQTQTQTQKKRPSPCVLDFGSLRLNCPSTSESISPLEPSWADLEITKVDDRSSRPAHQHSLSGQPTTRKRHREVSPDDAQEQRRKRERSTSTWFDD